MLAEQDDCPGCGLILRKGAGHRHAYLGSSASCWDLFGQLLEREYSNPAYMAVHRLTVDTYAAQHPGVPQARTIQSINLHLVGLHLTLERQLKPDYVRRVLDLLTRRKGRLQWLEPPNDFGKLTVADALTAQNAEEHAVRIGAWGRSVWQAWSLHHTVIAELAGSVMGAT